MYKKNIELKPLFKMENLLHKVYYDPESPVCFAGANAIHAHVRRIKPSLTLKNVKDFLNRQHAHTIHKQPRIKFRRNRVIAVGKDSHWQADLMDMRRLEKKNSGYTFVLTVIDVLSKYGFAEPVKKKTAAMVAKAFHTILKRSGRKPWYLFVDKGKEFKGEFQKYVRNNDIVLQTSESPDIKASNAERYNRTLKTRLWKYFTHNKTLRYVEVLPKIVNAINHSVSRPIKVRPVDVTFENDMVIWNRLYGEPSGKQTKFLYNIGDEVRISMERGVFHKGYVPQFSQTVFVVTEQLARDPPVYRIKDADSGESIIGVFYEQEMVPAV